MPDAERSERDLNGPYRGEGNGAGGETSVELVSGCKSNTSWGGGSQSVAEAGAQGNKGCSLRGAGPNTLM